MIFWRKVLAGTFLFCFYAVEGASQAAGATGGYYLRTTGVFAALGLREPLKHTPYRPASAGAEFFKSFRRYTAAHPPRRVYAGVVAEPLTSFVRTHQREAQWEGGATAGVRVLWRLGGRCTLTATATAGPFYHSARVEQQARGYLFSDNFSVGLLTRAGAASPLLLHAQLRYRHLSNGDTRMPNNGINTVHFCLGLLRAKSR